MRQALASSTRDLPQPLIGQVSYTPLVVTPQVSKHNPDRLVAFIGRQVCFFEKNGKQPEVGVPVEVMITRPLYRRDKDGYLNRDELIALVIRPVTADDILVEHNGFECSGSMCRTTASTIVDNSFVLLTPGRSEVFVADNVNPRFHGNELTARRPGRAWINRTQIRGSVARLEGLALIDDAAYVDVVRR